MADGMAFVPEEVMTANAQKIKSVDFTKKATNSLMSRVAEKSNETIQLSKGTIWFIGIAPAFIAMLIGWGGSAVSWARDDQSKTEQLKQVQATLEELKKNSERQNSELDKIRDSIHQQEIQKAKVESYQLGLADAHSTKEKK